MARLLETVYQEKAPVVDRAAGTIARVKLLGNESRNGRRYTEKAKASAARLYLGAKNYVNHGVQDGQLTERRLEDWASVITATKVESDGVYGVLKLIKTSPHYEMLMEAAGDKDFYQAFGMSHVADGDSRLDGTTELVEDVTKVLSVDFVGTPATTCGLAESEQPGKGQKPTIKTAIDSLPDSPIRRRLTEMMSGGYLDGSLAMEPAAPTDPTSQMAGLVKELIGMLGETLKALAVKKDTVVAPPAPAPSPTPDPNAEKPADEPATPEPGAEPEDPMADPTKPKTPADEKLAFESLKQQNAELTAKNLLLESGRDATAVRVKALARETDDKARKELLESWPLKAQANGEPDPERPERSPAAFFESEAGDASPEYIRERFASVRK